AHALATARQIEDKASRARALTLCIPVIEEPSRQSLVLETLAVAKSIEWGLQRAMAVSALLEYIDAATRNESVDFVVDVIQDGGVVGDARFKTDVLPRLAPLAASNPLWSRRIWDAIGQNNSKLSQITMKATLLPHLDTAAGAAAEE